MESVQIARRAHDAHLLSTPLHVQTPSCRNAEVQLSLKLR